MSTFKSGFVAIIGRPNVGKSTFVNNVLGKKVSIVSPKPQTTRNTIQAIYTTSDVQIIFLDTPGIHKPKHELGKIMNKYSLNTLSEVDLILLLDDVMENFGTGDMFLSEVLKKVKTPIFLVLNKIDIQKDKEKIMNKVLNWQEHLNFAEYFYISALRGDNISLLLEGITNYLEEGPKYYPEDQSSNNPESFIIAEIVREKVLLLTKEEVPHSIAVMTEQMQYEDNLLHIRETIYVERESQKKIIIGKNGELIKKIGTLARKEIVMLLGEKIYLDLWVKVEPDWRNKKAKLNMLGYNLENNAN